MTNETKQNERPATLVEQLRAVETYDERVAGRIAEFDVRMRGEEWMPGYCALGDYVSRGQLPKVDVAKTQKALIEETARDNYLLRDALFLTNSNPELSLESATTMVFGELWKNYENPRRYPHLECNLSVIPKLSSLIGTLPNPRDNEWYDHGRNLGSGLFLAIPGFITGVAFGLVFDFDDTTLFGSIGASLVSGALVGLLYSNDKSNQRRALKSLDEAHERLLPNAQYLDGKIEELYGGSSR